MHPHHIDTQSGSRPEEGKTPVLRLVAWETTRNCNLNCVHCRAAATRVPYSGELDTPAALRTLRRIVDTFHDHAEADDAMWRMIELAVDTRDYPRAGDLCDEFVTLFPHSALLGKVRDCRRNIERYIW